MPFVFFYFGTIYFFVPVLPLHDLQLERVLLAEALRCGQGTLGKACREG